MPIISDMNLKFIDVFFVAIYVGAICVLADDVKLVNASSESVQPSTVLIPNPSKQNATLDAGKGATENPLEIVVPSTNILNSTDTKVVPQSNSSFQQEIALSASSKQPITSTTKAPVTTGAPTKSSPQLHTTTSPDVDVVTPPEVGKWIIRNNATNTTCIIAQMAMQLNVTYPVGDNQVESTKLNGPGMNSSSRGSCNDSMQSMIISWGPGHSLQINFGINETAKDFYVSGFALNVNASILKNVTENTTSIEYAGSKQEFMTPLDMSYKCDRPQQVNLTSDGNLTAILTMKNTQFEAYMNSTKAEFGAGQDCEVVDTPDIVPIAVGCALAILVLVVLVAYLIGRKRSQNRGYLSM